MLDWNECPTVERVPGKVSGAWLFKGTRVPVAALFDNLEDGASVKDFLEWFPGATREQVDAVLNFSGEREWERIIAYLGPRPKLDSFAARAMNEQPVGLLDSSKL